jgi:alpha-1,3-mannosyltransferase
VLSKRLHSIYLLRCFNDGIAVMFLWFAIYCFQRRQFTIGTVLYSLGLGVKMALLLVLPALAVVITMDRGIYQAFIHMVLVVQQQALLGTPFILAYPVEYFTRAFEISRVFMYKWTVNWRFVSEETFLSKPFALALLALHAGTLIFFAVTRWIHPANRPVSFWVQKLLAKKEPLHGIQRKVAARVHGQYTLTTILTANAIGILFARSLHYQFYAYLAWSTPYLLWRGGFHPVIIYALWAAQELAWNVYPSTNVSSMVVVGVLALTVSRVWEGTKYDEYSAVTTASWRDNDN